MYRILFCWCQGVQNNQFAGTPYIFFYPTSAILRTVNELPDWCPYYQKFQLMDLFIRSHSWRVDIHRKRIPHFPSESVNYILKCALTVPISLNRTFAPIHEKIHYNTFLSVESVLRDIDLAYLFLNKRVNKWGVNVGAVTLYSLWDCETHLFLKIARTSACVQPCAFYVHVCSV